MTRTTNARLAGFMFLFYIANGITAMVLFDRAAAGATVAAKLASIAQHAPLMRVVAVLTLLTVIDALVLAVALYGITRDYDPELALLALLFRVVEGAVGAVGTIATLALVWAVTEGSAAAALGAMLLKSQNWTETIGASSFAFGSTIYCSLFLRARTIPRWLAWLGVIGSILTIASQLLNVLQLIRGPGIMALWIPIFLFEVIFGAWLLVKGVRA